MKYRSTRKKSPPVSFVQAMQQGLAPDGGLYLPEYFPDLGDSLWKDIQGKTLQDVGFQLCQKFISEADEAGLRENIVKAFPFDAPLVELDDQTFVLELFHGPTLAFKDFGARFMARMMGQYVQQADEHLVILVATSGDTGSAVGRAFEGVEGIDVVLLYPSGKVSQLQEKQLTTIGGNVTALEIDGVFDDCQKLVKQAFSDKKLRNNIPLSSANSINIARLLPQMFYYGRALAQLRKERTVHFCVPSGNFGNVTAGLIAAETGLPAGQFIAVTNVNDIVPQYLKTGSFEPRPSCKTISNAMDVGDPSNFERMTALYPEVGELKKMLWASSFDDRQTQAAIQKVYEDFDYIMDPHTAVGYLGVQEYRQEHTSDDNYLILATAHPAKFSDVVGPLIDKEIELPDSLKRSMEKPKQSRTFSASYDEFKEFLLDTFGG